MRHSKLSVTIPHEMYNDIRELTAKRKTKLSHLVTEALADKLRKIKEEAFVQQINEVFDDPGVKKEQRLMAASIANNTDMEELPW